MIASTPCDTYESSMSASKSWCEYPLSAGRPGKPSCAAQHVGDHVVVDDLAIGELYLSKQGMFSHSQLRIAAIARSMKPLCGSGLRKSAPALPRGHHPLRQRDVTICLSMLRRRQQMHPLFIEAADDKVHLAPVSPEGAGRTPGRR